MNPRLVKQILYGTGYLVFFGLIVFGIYYIWFKPAPTCFDNKKNQGETGVDCGGPCLSCEIRQLKPLEASWIKYFPSEGRLSIAAEIKNPNLDYGANGFSYLIDVMDKEGGLIKNISGQSVSYAGEIKYLVEITEVDYQKVGEARINLSNFNWQSKQNFSAPDVQLREIKTQAANADNTGISVNGFLANQNAFGLSKARLVAFLINQNGNELAASKTELENIPAFQ